ncbi:MAG: RNA-binding domain-containing protein [Bryobacteraceae bacterium]|jgi:hypothetical protein
MIAQLNRDALLQKAAASQKESKYVDFKERLDVESIAEWCEITKDIVAMANSGGGIIVFGLQNNGAPSGFDGTPLLSYDTAKVTDKVAKYTNKQFAEFEWLELDRRGHKLAALAVYSAALPIVFTKAGTYRADNGKEKIAFHQGTIYFRHGAKSEPGDSDDLTEIINREVERLRKVWLSNIKKVTQAPPGSVVEVASPSARQPLGAHGVPVRIVADENAPGVRPERADNIWPHRAKDLISLVNHRLAGGGKINTYDVQCVRKVFEIETKRPEFCYRPFALTSPQYSEAFVDWLVAEYSKDNSFFLQTRQRAQPAQ